LGKIWWKTWLTSLELTPILLGAMAKLIAVAIGHLLWNLGEERIRSRMQRWIFAAMMQHISWLKNSKHLSLLIQVAGSDVMYNSCLWELTSRGSQLASGTILTPRLSNANPSVCGSKPDEVGCRPTSW